MLDNSFVASGLSAVLSLLALMLHSERNYIKYMENKYPGYRHMTASQRYNARMDRIWEKARANGALEPKEDEETTD